MGASLHQQLLVHLRRQSTLAVRDPTLYSVRLVIFLATNAMFALVYLDTRDRHQGQVTNKAFLRLSPFIPARLPQQRTYAFLPSHSQ